MKRNSFSSVRAAAPLTALLLSLVLVSGASGNPGWDFGDAPEPPYPTLLASDGARHVYDPGIFLGAGVDVDPDGMPSPDAMGDDVNGAFDDEDGVTFVSPLIPGAEALIEVVASAPGSLSAWVDFDQNGDWLSPGDEIAAGYALLPGLNPLPFTVPASALQGTTYARFRFTSAGALPPSGEAPDGEVEDYQVTIQCQTAAPTSDPGGPYVLDMGDDLVLDGSGSSDPDAGCGDSIVLYEWDLDDDGQFDDAAGAAPTVPWATVVSLGLAYPADPSTGLPSNTVGLRVTDSFGASDSSAATLTIYDNSPAADLHASPNPAACGQSVTFDGSGSSHGHPGHGIVQYEWDFDDSDGISFQAGTSSEAHAYGQWGSYTATLRVTDDNVPAKTDTDTVSVSVSLGNGAPTSDPGGPYVLDMGDDLALDGSGSSDPDAGCGDSIVLYEWDLDDDGQFDDAAGAAPTVPWATLQALVCGAGCTPGQAHRISLKVYDSFGLSSSGGTTVTITVAPSNDLLIDFGPGEGLWVNYNDDPSSWGQVHASDPGPVCVADLDNAGGREVVVHFPGAGVWVNYNDDPSSWGLIHPSNPVLVAVGDLDGGGRDDVVLAFDGAGVWVNYNDDPALWRQIHTGSPEILAVGDLDGAAGDDVVMDFGGPGVWVNYNDDPLSWRQIHASSPELMVLGDLDGSGRDDVALDFGAAGVWVNYNDDPLSWRQVHAVSPELMVAGDVDGGGRDDLVLDFGPADGVWTNLNDDPASWRQVHTLSPTAMATGDLDKSGADEVIVDFGAGVGIWANYDNGPSLWRQVHTSTCEGMTTGNVDGN